MLCVMSCCLAQDAGFLICLVVALAHAQRVEEVRVFEDMVGAGVRGCDRLSPSEGGAKVGEFDALEDFALAVLAPLACGAKRRPAN